MSDQYRETLAEAAAREFGFNPDQARGPGGKWIHIGAMVEHAVHGKGKVTDTHHLGKVSVRFDRPSVGLKKVAGKDLTPMAPSEVRRRAEMEANDEKGLARTLDRINRADKADEGSLHRKRLQREAARKAAQRPGHRPVGGVQVP